MLWLLIILIVALYITYNSKKETFEQIQQKEIPHETIGDSRYGGYPNIFPDTGSNEWINWWNTSKSERIPYSDQKNYYDFTTPFKGGEK